MSLPAVPPHQHDFTNPPTRPPGVQVTGVILIVLGAMSLMLRLYTHVRLKRHLGLDDLFATTGTAFVIATLLGQIIVYTKFHQGRHTWDIPAHTIVMLRKVEIVYLILFSQGALQLKTSLLCFARKMMGKGIRPGFVLHYVALIALMTVVALSDILFIVLTLTGCRPLKAAWDLNPTYHYTCFNTEYFFLFSGIINTVTDFLCTILPAAIVLKVEMPVRKRIAVASIFFIGIFVNIASVLRIYYFAIAHISGDYWNAYPAAVAGNFEVGLGAICVNIPTIRPLVRRAVDWYDSSHAATYACSSQYAGGSQIQSLSRFSAARHGPKTKLSKQSKNSRLDSHRTLGSIDEPFKLDSTGAATITAAPANDEHAAYDWVYLRNRPENSEACLELDDAVGESMNYTIKRPPPVR